MPSKSEARKNAYVKKSRAHKKAIAETNEVEQIVEAEQMEQEPDEDTRVPCTPRELMPHRVPSWPGLFSVFKKPKDAKRLTIYLQQHPSQKKSVNFDGGTEYLPIDAVKNEPKLYFPKEQWGYGIHIAKLQFLQPI